jgi:hypothetical protein
MEDYDKAKIAALVRRAQGLTAHLKGEADEIETLLRRVLNGDEDEILNALQDQRSTYDARTLAKPMASRTFWQFWR